MKKMIGVIIGLLILAGCQSVEPTPYLLKTDEAYTQYQYTVTGVEEPFTLVIPFIHSNEEELSNIEGPAYSLNPTVENVADRGLTNSTFYKNDDVDTFTKDRVYNYAQYGYGYWVLNNSGKTKAGSGSLLNKNDYELLFGDFYHKKDFNNLDYIKYYVATQELIWETIINPDTQKPYQVEFTDIDVENEKQQILNAQQEYGKTPFFNGSVINVTDERLAQDVPFEFEDVHGVLNRFTIQASDTVTLLESENENTIKFNVNGVDRNTKISFIPAFKVNKEYSEVFSSNDNVSYVVIGQERALNMISSLFIEKVSNTNTISLAISTYDIDTKTEIFGAQYQISTGPEFLSPIETTLSTPGQPSIIESLVPGTYYIQQIVAPEGYALNQEVETISIGAGIQEMVHPFYNVKK